MIFPPWTDDEWALAEKLAFLYPDSRLDRVRWFQTPNAMLGGERPSACWQDGRVDEVLQVLEMLEMGAFG